MSNPGDGGPAFPSGKSEKTGYENTLPYYEGMTLRDLFAGQALTGMLDRTYGMKIEIIAARSYEMADAMIAARNNLP
jgi:hypothetical protein